MSDATTSELYLPMPLAIETGALDISAVTPQCPQEAAIGAANGRVPGEAGVVMLPDGSVGAFDFVALSGSLRDKGQLAVEALPKALVDRFSGLVSGAGHIVLSRVGTIQPVFEVLPWVRAQWFDGFRQIGSMGVRGLGIENQTLEVVDTSQTGLTVQAPKRYF